MSGTVAPQHDAKLACGDANGGAFGGVCTTAPRSAASLPHAAQRRRRERPRARALRANPVGAQDGRDYDAAFTEQE